MTRWVAFMLLLGLLGLNTTGCAIIYTARYQKGNKQIKEIGICSEPGGNVGIPLYRDIQQVNEDGAPIIVD